MNVHYLQGQAQSTWQEELDFVYAGAFLITVKPQTYLS